MSSSSLIFFRILAKEPTRDTVTPAEVIDKRLKKLAKINK